MKIGLIFLGIAVCLFLTVSIGDASETTCDELIQESERQWLESKFDDSDQLLDRAVKICPNRAELYWRKARNIYDRIEDIPRDQKPDKDTLIKHYLALEAFADKCIELDKKDGNCWLWKGIGLGRQATTEGVLKSFWIGSQLEDTWLKALSLKPKYRAEDGTANALGDTYHALGMYYRVVPEWLCYFPLKQIVGTCGDKEKSVEYQRRAVALEPKRIEYLRGLGVSLLCHGQSYERPEEIEEGKKILKDLQSLPDLKPYDKIDKQHARMLLEDPSLACGYQRDSQQELSKEAYQKNQ
jgi:hypothetical protein